MNNRFRRLIAAFLAVGLSVSVLSACSMHSVRELEKTSFLYDTVITIKLRDVADAEAVMEDTLDLCRRYDRLFDRFDAQSDLYRINHSAGQPCTVSEDTLELIRLGLDYSQLSDGLFDITCGRVTGLWDFSAETPTLPDSSRMASALESVDWHRVTLSGSDVTVPDGTELDAGGIAKGFIADRITDYLYSRGVKSAVVNLGGNVSLLGTKDGHPFSIGVQSPFEEGGILGQLDVADCSVVTAGSYQRCFELDGVSYHHILDLTDGMPCRSGLASVTVICRSSAQADALATICFMLGTEDGLELIESTGGAEAVFIAEDGTVTTSSGAADLFTLYE